MLQFRYGTYAFPAGSVQFSSTAERLYSARGFPVSIRRRMELTYEMQGTNPADLTRKIVELQNALVPGRDLVLSDEQGRPTAHYLRSSESHGGVRVISDGFPVGDGTEYVTFRTINIGFEADFPVRGLEPLLEFSEQVSIVGDGGPEEIYLPLLKGKWQKQTISERSIVRATQQGEAVGWGRYPDVPNPIWPSFEVRGQRQITKTSPKRAVGQTGECRVSWSYSFESNEPLIGSPTVI